MTTISPTCPIRILLVDDHEIFLVGLRSVLLDEPGLEIVGKAHSGTAALEAVVCTQPDVVLLDLALGDKSGIDVLEELIKAATGARFLVLTGLPDPQLHLRAVCLGAMGVVMKTDALTSLVKAIRKVHAGEAWLNRAMVGAAMTRMRSHSQQSDPDVTKISSLTARELEVIASLGEGRRNKDIADRLFISEKTVRHYFTSIFGKLEVSDRLELIIYAYQHNLAKVPATQTAAAGRG